MAYFNKVCAVLFVASCMFATGSCDVKECYQQNCKECPSKDVDEGNTSQVRCELRGLVDTTWLGQENSKPVSNPQDMDIEYACLKMVASSRTYIGDSTDVIRGCVLKVNAENMCTLLKGMENSRQKETTSCVICNDDNCNGAFSSHHAPAAFLLMAVAAIIKFFSF